jgi:hypothetical protein
MKIKKPSNRYNRSQTTKKATQKSSPMMNSIIDVLVKIFGALVYEIVKNLITS